MTKDTLFDYNRWPWLESSTLMECNGLSKKAYPKVSIVIPSFNQGFFIEETIRSVIFQDYPNLEIIIIDGGSKDNTLEIIKKYEKYITYWVSEPDNGQSHAINKGFIKCTGDWVAWMNSDDCYLPGALNYLFADKKYEDYSFMYGNYFIGESLYNHKEINVINGSMLSVRKLLYFFYGVDYIIPSQSVFVKRELLNKVGLLNEKLHYCMDLEWYVRILLQKPKIVKYNKTLCFFRYNQTTKTSQMSRKDISENRMIVESEEIALSYESKLNYLNKWLFRRKFNYYQMYPKYIKHHENSDISYLMKVLFRHPYHGLRDRRLLGLLKLKLIKRFRLSKLQ